jgi:hypothetical protein
VIRIGVDRPGLLWTRSFMENPALIRRAYPMSE